MHSEKGSATVPVALFGVSPNRWCGRFDAPYGAPRRMRPARRRDADEIGRDDRAPQLQLHRSGLVGPGLALSLGNPNTPKMLPTWVGQFLARLSVHEFLSVVAQKLKLCRTFVGIKDDGLRV